MDIDLLLVLRNKERYTKYARFIKASAVGEETWNILQAMGEWFKHNAVATEVVWKHFNAWFCLVRHAKMDKTKQAIYKELIDKLEVTPEPDESHIKPLLEGLITRDYAAQIAEKALKIADGDFTVSVNSIVDLVEQRNSAIGKVDSVDRHILLPTLEGMASVSAPGLRWRLECLNLSLGDLRRGDLVVVGTRPDTGKTTLLASEASFMAPQLPEDQCVLWVNNEEEGNKVFRRIIQSTLGITTAKLESNFPAALEAYKTTVGRIDKIVMLNKADVHVRDVEHLVKKYNVGLVIFDQLWKVHGFDEESGNEVTRQTLLFNWARELAKKIGPVITVHQADGSAEGVKWIDMSKLYGSKTGIQGEADAIVTIGRLPDTGDTRYVYVPKNKMAGKDPSKRNGMFEIQIEKDIGRFKE